jgi:hypothetical protein
MSNVVGFVLPVQYSITCRQAEMPVDPVSLILLGVNP